MTRLKLSNKMRSIKINQPDAIIMTLQEQLSAYSETATMQDMLDDSCIAVCPVCGSSLSYDTYNTGRCKGLEVYCDDNDCEFEQDCII